MPAMTIVIRVTVTAVISRDRHHRHDRRDRRVAPGPSPDFLNENGASDAPFSDASGKRMRR